MLQNAHSISTLSHMGPYSHIACGLGLYLTCKCKRNGRCKIIPLSRIYPLPPSPHDLHMFTRCTILRFALSFSMGKAHEWWTFTKCRVWAQAPYFGNPPNLGLYPTIKWKVQNHAKILQGTLFSIFFFQLEMFRVRHLVEAIVHLELLES
jgi:hypothetical protein